MDGAGHGEKEAKTVLEIPNSGAGEGIFVQRVRLKAEAVGAREKSQPNGEASQNLVPEQTDEEQEEHAEAGGSAT